jgi:hypothetical protein
MSSKLSNYELTIGINCSIRNDQKNYLYKSSFFLGGKSIYIADYARPSQANSFVLSGLVLLVN